MFVTFNDPQQEQPQTWTFDAGRVKASLAEMIEKRAGESFEAWVMSVRAGKARARRVLLWHLISLQHPIKFEDTPDFAFEDLKVEHSAAEVATMIDHFSRIKFDDLDQREQVLGMLQADLETAREREGLDGDEDPVPKVL